MSELRRSIDKKISNMTGPFTIRDLLPDADSKKRNIASAYMSELMRKKIIKAAGRQKRFRLYEPIKPYIEKTPSEAISEHQMGEAIYDLVTSLKNDLTAAKRELSTEKTQAKLRSAEYSKQLREKNQELKDLRDEIELLERRAQRVVRVPRTIARATLFSR